MNREGFILWRIVYPATLIFFLVSLLYALGLGDGVFLPIERWIRGLSIPRYLVNLMLYAILFVIVFLGYRVWGNDDEETWFDVLSSNRGGMGWFDVAILFTVVVLMYIGWRYLDYFNPELLVLGVIAAFTSLVGMFRSPPWRHIFIVQRANSGDLIPTVSDILNGLGYDDLEEEEMQNVRELLQRANPLIDFDNPMAGEEIYVPPSMRPQPTLPPEPVAPEPVIDPTPYTGEETLAEPPSVDEEGISQIDGDSYSET